MNKVKTVAQFIFNFTEKLYICFITYYMALQVLVLEEKTNGSGMLFLTIMSRQFYASKTGIFLIISSFF